jgi:hypothetical protein
VRLWLAVCQFGGELYLHYMYDKLSQEKFCNNVLKIIQRKCERFRPKHNYFTMSCIGILKEGETFDSVLEALWEYQKSLLPDDVSYRIFEHSDGRKFIFPEKITFYDPATQIITITSWEGEE